MANLTMEDLNDYLDYVDRNIPDADENMIKMNTLLENMIEKKSDININIKDEYGSGILHYIIGSGYKKVEKILLFVLDYEATTTNILDVNMQNSLGETPLYAAAQYGDLNSIRLLFLYGADPNIPSYSGETPLYIAARCGNFHSAKLLLDHGADPYIRTKAGSLPRDTTSNDKVFELLVSYMGRKTKSA